MASSESSIAIAGSIQPPRSACPSGGVTSKRNGAIANLRSLCLRPRELTRALLDPADGLSNSFHVRTTPEQARLAEPDGFLDQFVVHRTFIARHPASHRLFAIDALVMRIVRERLHVRGIIQGRVPAARGDPAVGERLEELRPRQSR